MNDRIICYTLFDITQTGVLNRAKPGEDQVLQEWILKRNQQCNFDTLMQAISLRSQPELTNRPEKMHMKLDVSMFGFLYENDERTFPVWKFEFTVQHSSVFEDGLSELGALYNDCDGIPMIKCGTEIDTISNFLDTTPELKNLHFAKVNHG